jgi:hypothetical protein
MSTALVLKKDHDRWAYKAYVLVSCPHRASGDQFYGVSPLSNDTLRAYLLLQEINRRLLRMFMVPPSLFGQENPNV